jgi:hypothetical protein
MKTNEFRPYRDSLKNRGIINGDDRGIVRMTLPYFEEYIKDCFYEEM